VTQRSLIGLGALVAMAVMIAWPAKGYCEDPAAVVAEMAEELKQEQVAVGDFTLGPGDLLEVSVWNDETLTRQVLVRPDGFISFPLIGDIQVEGRTVDQVRAAVEKEISEYVPDVPVTVLLIQLASTRVYVIGKVPQPGAFLMQDQMRVLQILSMAGGLTTFADQGDIKIIRYDGEDQQVFEFDYDEVARGRDLSQNIVLEPGDTVVVP